jgi:pimeloyl-ACP methyl ester carboxylesterase
MLLRTNENASQTLFFIHGNSGSSLMWSKQFSSELKRQYRLIAIDLPGHGKSFHSQKPEDDYSPLGTAAILIKVVKMLVRNESFILVGFSYGTNVLAETLNSIMPKGIVLLSPCVLGKNHPLEDVFVKTEAPSIFFYNETNTDVIQNWFSRNLFAGDPHQFQQLISDYEAVDPEFKPSLFKAAADGKVSDEIVAIEESTIDVCVVFGKKDPLVNVNYLDDIPFTTWNHRLYKVSEAGHWLNVEQPDAFNDVVSRYAEFVF